MQKDDIADFSRTLHELMTPLRCLQMRPMLWVVLGICIGRRRRREGFSGRENAFRMLGEIVGGQRHCIRTDVGPATPWMDGRINGDYEQSLLGRVQEVHL